MHKVPTSRRLIGRATIALALTFSLLAGCKRETAASGGGAGGSSSSAPEAHCDMSRLLGECHEYNHLAMVAGGAHHQRMCPTNGGTWGTGACPAQNVVGTCVSAGTTIRAYSTGENPVTAERAQSRCTNIHAGTFRAGQ